MSGKPRLFRDLRESAGEQSSAAVRLSLYFFLITAAAYIIKVVKTSLFLNLSITKLPLAYLVTAAAMGFIVTLNARFLQRLPKRSAILGTLAFFAAGLILLRILLPGHGQSGGLLILNWLWGDVFLVMSVTQFWILSNDVFPPRRAKALVGSFVKSGLLGGIAGSFAASRLAGPLGTINLLLAALALLVAAAVIVEPALRRMPLPLFDGGAAPPGGRPRVGYRQSFQALTQNRYLIYLCGAMIAAMAVTTVIEFQFNSVLQLEPKLAGDSARTAFLGTFFTILFIVSYLLQAGLTRRVLQVFGLRGAILVTPVALLLGTAAALVVPGSAALVWAIGLRGADKSLTHTFSQSTREILYVPVPPRLRARAKVFIDMFVNKLGDGAAALLLLAFNALFHPDWRGVGFLTAACLLVWIAFNLGLMREYGSVVKANLSLQWPDADKVVLDRIDVDAAKLVFDTLESRNRSSALYAMNMMDLVKRERLSPDLREILAAGTSRVRAGALGDLLDAGGEPLYSGWDEGIEEAGLDDQVREILSLGSYQEVMKRNFEKWAARPGPQDVVSQMEAAKALGLMPADSPLAASLRPLLRSDSPDVARYALESAGKLSRREDVPLILPLLAHPLLGDAAARALQAYGDRIAGTLADAMADAGEPAAVRKALPGVLGRAGTQRAATALVRILGRRDEGIRAEVVEALVRMRVDGPRLIIPEARVHAELLRSAERCCALIERAAEGGGGQAKSDLAGLGLAFKQIFDLLSLSYAHGDVIRAWQNFSRGDRRAVDYSLDLLEHLLRREDKDVVLPLLEDAPADEKARRCRELRRRSA